jgi:cytoskeletal protein CcmA (bactofilin family)
MSAHTNTQNNQPNAAPEMTVIGPDTTIKGEMFFEKSARILGTFEGKIAAQGEVQIGATANCNAAVEASRVVVDGRVSGPITASDRITLTQSAHVQGDLTAGTLVVAEGASFVGHCQVGPHAAEMTGAEPQNQSQHSTQYNQQLANERATELKNNLATPVDLTPPWAQQRQTTGDVA